MGEGRAGEKIRRWGRKIFGGGGKFSEGRVGKILGREEKFLVREINFGGCGGGK